MISVGSNVLHSLITSILLCFPTIIFPMILPIMSPEGNHGFNTLKQHHLFKSTLNHILETFSLRGGSDSLYGDNDAISYRVFLIRFQQALILSLFPRAMMWSLDITCCISVNMQRIPVSLWGWWCGLWPSLPVPVVDLSLSVGMRMWSLGITSCLGISM